MMRSRFLVMAALAIASCSPAPDTQPARQQGDATLSKPGLRKPDVRYEPSPPGVVKAMLRLAEVGKDDIVYDLGSGDGRIPIAAARDFGARGVGIEIDPKLVARAVRNAREAGVSDRVSFRNEDLFTADFSDATVVTLFLYPDVNMKLRPKLRAMLRPGTRLISHWHDMEDWKPDRIVHVEGRPIYLWTIKPDEAAGASAR